MDKLRQITKIVIFLILVSLCTNTNALSFHQHNPEHDDKPSDYSFSYGVKDLHTGDVKHQWEKKHGNTVHGHYSIMEPDGTIRTVDYTASPKAGFNAIVKHTAPTHHHPRQPSPALSHSEVVLKPEFGTLRESYRTEYEYGAGSHDDYADELATNLQPVEVANDEEKDRVEIEQLEPVEIDLTKGAEGGGRGYYLEGGFRPITTPASEIREKKVVMTPGLRNFSGRRKEGRFVKKKEEVQRRNHFFLYKNSGY